MDHSDDDIIEQFSPLFREELRSHEQLLHPQCKI